MTSPDSPAIPDVIAPFPDDDAMTALAQRLQSTTGCPAAVVALADPERGWWSGSAGLEEPGDGATVLTALALQTLLHPGPWLVADCLKDPDLRLHPCVVGRPWLRSLAGLPLIGRDGRVLGALCALGFEPFSLSEPSLSAMESLGRNVVTVLQHHGLGLELQRLARGDAGSSGALVPIPGATLVKRGVFLHALEAMFQLGVAQGFSLLRLECRDLDRLRANLGEVGTAELMDDLAGRILTLLPEQASACHYSEEELLVLIPQLEGAEPLGLLARQLLGVIESPFLVKGQRQPVEVALAVGATVVDGSQTSAAAVLAEAGMARRLASESAGSAYQLIDGSMRREVRHTFNRQNHFREALLQGGLLPYYQPIVDLRQGRILGFEALARWRGVDDRVASPAEFLTLAQQMGLTGELDLEMIRQVFEALPTFAAARPCSEAEAEEEMVMSVNLSAQLLDDPVLRGRLLQWLESNPIPAGWRLQVEILEEAMQESSAGFEEFLSRLAVHKVAIAIDDFGTGYSSLSRLDQLPIQSFKIDRSFVERIDDGLSPSNQLMRTMNSLAIDLGLTATVEGVGNEAQRDWLAAHGFVNGQGYFFSHPLPLEEALGCLRCQKVSTTPTPSTGGKSDGPVPVAVQETNPVLPKALGRLLRDWFG